MDKTKLLQLSGRVEETLELSFDQLAEIQDGQVPDAAVCGGAAVDTCANVKRLTRLELS